MGKVLMRAGGGSLSGSDIKPENLVVGTSIKVGGKEIKGGYPYSNLLLKNSDGIYDKPILEFAGVYTNSSYTKTFTVQPGKKYLLPVIATSYYNDNVYVMIYVGNSAVISTTLMQSTLGQEVDRRFMINVPEGEDTIKLYCYGTSGISRLCTIAYFKEPFLIGDGE